MTSGFPSGITGNPLSDNPANPKHGVTNVDVEGGPTAPSVANGPGVGTAPPAATLAAGATNHRGVIRLGSGTSTAAGVIATVTFGDKAENVGDVVILQAGNAATAALGQLTATGVSQTGFSVTCATAPTASQAAGTFVVNYDVAE